MITYTAKELNDKKYMLQDVITAVKARLDGRKYCSNPLGRYDDESRFTLKELNDLADEVVMETEFHDGNW